MRSLNLAVKLRCSRFDIDVPNTQVFHMPMELRLELVTAIGSDLLDAKREFADHMTDKVNCIFLRIEPPRNFRRLISLSQAAMAGFS